MRSPSSWHCAKSRCSSVLGCDFAKRHVGPIVEELFHFFKDFRRTGMAPELFRQEVGKLVNFSSSLFAQGKQIVFHEIHFIDLEHARAGRKRCAGARRSAQICKLENSCRDFARISGFVSILTTATGLQARSSGLHFRAIS